MARRDDIGDGDVCPLNARHGNMLHVKGSQVQYCAHQSHDRRPKSHPLGEAEATRCFWPTGWRSFEEAVKLYHGATTKAAGEPSALPELDITLEV